MFAANARARDRSLIVLRDHGRVVARARIPAFAAERRYTRDLRPRITRGSSGARLCFDNEGRATCPGRQPDAAERRRDPARSSRTTSARTSRRRGPRHASVGAGGGPPVRAGEGRRRRALDLWRCWPRSGGRRGQCPAPAREAAVRPWPAARGPSLRTAPGAWVCAPWRGERRLLGGDHPHVLGARRARPHRLRPVRGRDRQAASNGVPGPRGPDGPSGEQSAGIQLPAVRRDREAVVGPRQWTVPCAGSSAARSRAARTPARR